MCCRLHFLLYETYTPHLFSPDLFSRCFLQWLTVSTEVLVRHTHSFCTEEDVKDVDFVSESIHNLCFINLKLQI